MEQIITGFNQGKGRKVSPAYKRLAYQIAKRRKAIDRLKTTSKDAEAINKLRGEIAVIDRERKNIPSRDPLDKRYKRLHYCRYADDFVIGVIGSKQDAEGIFTRVRTFLNEQLNLAISATKSKIRYSRESIPFLARLS